ncbi:hypothetical protein PTKIN_Ptkin08bG0174000 [Pterospermum kingtungense]
MALYQAKLSFSITITVLFAISQAKSFKLENKCHGSCATSNFTRTLPFPFGYSPGCPIQLNCSSTGVSIGEFNVRNITSTDIIVNLPGNCQRPIYSLSVLFGENYALSASNSLLLQNCSKPSASPCEIRPMFLDRSSKLNPCFGNSDNITCFSGSASGGFLSFEEVNSTQCRLLFSSTSIVMDSATNSAVSLEMERVNLEWWINGDCNCDGNANCTNVMNGNRTMGFRCVCKEGFEGDGFKEGSGCRRGESTHIGQ